MKKIRCKKCNKLKYKKDFVKDRLRSGGIYPWCKTCHSDKQKEYKTIKYEAPVGSTGIVRLCSVCLSSLEGAHSNRLFCCHKCKERARRLDCFGLTPENFRELTKSGKCPLCLCNVKKWVIDHNHTTGETMSPVCHRCNQYLLAGSQHNLEIAKRLVEFLENSPVKKLLGEKRFIGPQQTSQLHRMWGWSQDKQKASNG